MKVSHPMHPLRRVWRLVVRNNWWKLRCLATGGHDAYKVVQAWTGKYQGEYSGKCGRWVTP